MVFKGTRTLSHLHHDPLVVKLIVAYEINLVHINTRSSIYVIFCDCLLNLVQARGTKGEKIRQLMVDFEVMDVPLAYNLVVDKQLLNLLRVTLFTYNL